MYTSFLNTLFIVAHCVSYFTTPAIAVSVPHFDPSNETAAITHARGDDSKPWLRILPLGASVIKGMNSNPENGFRKPLRDDLVALGYPVNMVGCASSGTMVDKQHESWPGKIVSQMKDLAKCALGQKPNLVLINAGTNDCLTAERRGGLEFVRSSYDSMKELLEFIFSEVEDTTVILSTLLPNRDPKAYKYIKLVNEGYRRLFEEMKEDGKKIELAEMYYEDKGPITLNDLTDGTHPDNQGYVKMANIWMDAFKKVEGGIRDPKDIGHPDDGNSQCLPAEEGKAGWENGVYVHTNVQMDNITSVRHSSPKGKPGILNQFHFAELVKNASIELGGATDELIRVVDPDQTTSKEPFISYRLNKLGAYEETWNAIEVGMKCSSADIQWGDINGDGLDDFVCIDESGNVDVSINKGGNPPTFESIGRIKDGQQDRVQLADINGDGRADYCIMTEDKIFCLLNNFVKDAKPNEWWGPMAGDQAPTVAKDKDVPNMDGIRFVEMNGDRRNDVVLVSDDGSTEIYTNQQGTPLSKSKAARPVWVEAFTHHVGFKEPTHVKFGRVYGSGRADYLRVFEQATDVDGKTEYQYDFQAFKNTGANSCQASKVYT